MNRRQQKAMFAKSKAKTFNTQRDIRFSSDFDDYEDAQKTRWNYISQGHVRNPNNLVIRKNRNRDSYLVAISEDRT